MGEVVERIVVDLVLAVYVGQEVLEVFRIDVLTVEVLHSSEDLEHQWLEYLLLQFQQVQVNAFDVDTLKLHFDLTAILSDVFKTAIEGDGPFG